MGRVSRLVVAAAATALLAPAIAVTSASSASAAPSVTILSPADGATASGSVDVTVTATSPYGTLAASVYVYLEQADRATEVPCPAPLSRTCSVTTTLDLVQITGGTYALGAALRDNNLGTTFAQPLSITVVNDSGSITIESPVEGATLSGVVQTTVTATLGPSAPIASLEGAWIQVRDGGRLDQSQQCNGLADPTTCSVTVPWDTRWDDGPHVLSAALGAGYPQPLLGLVSRRVPVVVANPPATIDLTAPAPGGVVTGITAVLTHSAIPAALGTTPEHVELDVDGFSVGKTSCAPSTDGTCDATTMWDTDGLAGAHVLEPVLVDSVGHRIPGTPTTVYVHTVPVVSLVLPASHAGSTVAAQVIAKASDGQPLKYTPVTVTIAPAVGPATVLHLTTTRAGGARFSFPATTNARVTADLAAGVWWEATRKVAAAAVIAPFRCTWTRTVKPGTYASGTCTVPYIGSGTPVSMQMRRGAAWPKIGSGRTGRHYFRFRVLSKSRGIYYIRFALYYTRYYTRSISQSLRLVFR
ncbi:MAG: hypothetical protein GC157_00115 [Frankiales bacterium]|nr:hypothetical protein [Frankiales bacterium]